MCNLFCNFAAKQVGEQCCGFYNPRKKLAALFVAKTGPNVGGNM